MDPRLLNMSLDADSCHHHASSFKKIVKSWHRPLTVSWVKHLEEIRRKICLVYQLFWDHSQDSSLYCLGLIHSWCLRNVCWIICWVCHCITSNRKDWVHWNSNWAISEKLTEHHIYTCISAKAEHKALLSVLNFPPFSSRAPLWAEPIYHGLLYRHSLPFSTLRGWP